eukprot:TRINITY_DN13087_c0_g1_i1.p1 TRINITY_DN13087_c0_g1~~TRINITY_DN13087_c0_g1_i1.p1  ORF type:complete len:133 (-),score=16.77 TRINITY_DN13087_c0_g1_i1:36-434(-)
MSTPTQNPQANAEPNPSLRPEEVISIQLDSLQNNDIPTPDAGIAVCFRFASPSNKLATGPLSRFTQMIHNPLYSCMINFEKAKFEPLATAGYKWKITIIKSGIQHVFAWHLSKQLAGPYKDCWMTDAVMKLQ